MTFLHKKFAQFVKELTKLLFIVFLTKNCNKVLKIGVEYEIGTN